MSSNVRPLRLDAAWMFRGVLISLAVAPLSTKVAGAAWVLYCCMGLWVALRRPRCPLSLLSQTSSAARTWLVACLIGLALEVGATALWHDPWDELHAPIRLALGAAATLALVRRSVSSDGVSRVLANLLSVAGLVALGLTLWNGSGRSYPTNAIPWSVATSFAVCVLLPYTVDRRSGPQLRTWWLIGAIAGVLAVVQGQTRGAYGIVLWVIGFYVWAGWRRGRSVSRGFGLGVCAVALVAGAVALLPEQILHHTWQRVESAVSEFERATPAKQPGDGANSSVGARLYLWRMAAHGFIGSPWVGVGSAERKRLIVEEGQRRHAPLISGLSHVHNQYLHSAMDHGLLGLIAVFAWIGGLGTVAWQMRRVDKTACAGLAGILFMHASGSLTNTNFAHNYYGVMLSIYISVVMVTAVRRRGTEGEAQADRYGKTVATIPPGPTPPQCSGG